MANFYVETAITFLADQIQGVYRKIYINPDLRLLQLLEEETALINLLDQTDFSTLMMEIHIHQANGSVESLIRKLFDFHGRLRIIAYERRIPFVMNGDWTILDYKTRVYSTLGCLAWFTARALEILEESNTRHE